MKKILSLLMIFALLLSFGGCTANAPQAAADESGKRLIPIRIH